MKHKSVTILNPCFSAKFLFEPQDGIFPRLFSSLHVTKSPVNFPNPSVSNLPFIESQWRTICKEPNFKFAEAVSHFHHVVDLGFFPSGPTCNFLVHMLVKNKEHKLAYEVYNRMVQFKVSPIFLSLAALIECFTYFQKPKYTVAVLGLITKNGFSINSYLMNISLKCFCDCGMAVKALDLFSEMMSISVVPDIVSFNTLMKGLCKEKRVKEALDLKGRMEEANVAPNQISYTILIDGLCVGGEVDNAMELVREMKLKGLNMDVVLYSTLINGVCNIGDVDKGKDLFDEMVAEGVSPNAFTYTCLMNGFCKQGKMKETKGIFETMIQSGIRPDVATFTGLINWLCQDGQTSKALKMFDFMVEKGEEPNNITYNILLNGLSSNGLLADASEILRRMLNQGKRPDVVTYNTIMKGLFQNRKTDDAMALFDLMVSDKSFTEPDAWTYTMVIKGLCKAGRLNQATDIQHRLVERKITGIAPNFRVLIGSYLRIGNIKKAMELWKQVAELGLIEDSGALSGLIEGFCCLNILNVAKGAFLKMWKIGHPPNLLDYNTLMTALCKEGSLEQGRRLLQEMINGNCKPDVASYNIIVDSTLKSGDLEYANSLLLEMLQKGLNPDALTFSILINRFSKLGQMEEAKKFVRENDFSWLRTKCCCV